MPKGRIPTNEEDVKYCISGSVDVTVFPPLAARLLRPVLLLLRPGAVVAVPRLQPLRRVLGAGVELHQGEHLNINSGTGDDERRCIYWTALLMLAVPGQRAGA